MTREAGWWPPVGRRIGAVLAFPMIRTLVAVARFTTSEGKICPVNITHGERRL